MLMSNSRILTSRYPDIRTLAHKDTFANMMRFCQTVCPDEFKFVPPTFILNRESEMKLFQAYQKKYSKNTFIAKPTTGSQGDSIFLFKNLNELPGSTDIIVQKYMDKPLLLDGIKFDLRVYVVIVSVDPIQAYVCNEGLARFCTK